MKINMTPQRDPFQKPSLEAMVPYDIAEGSILEAEFGGNGPRRHAFALRQRITTTIR